MRGSTSAVTSTGVDAGLWSPKERRRIGLWSHGCALLAKMLASGPNRLASSNVQTRTPTTSGRVDTCT
jgi:hypothetical protein